MLGLSGGIDCAVVAYLCARALGPAERATRSACRTARRAPSRSPTRSASIDALGINAETIEISAAVDGYLQHAPDADPRRKGNVMARMRMLVLFDQSAKRNALPVGTGNKTERLMGYFTWHADDTPPVNPIGDLFKTQVWALARHLGVPERIDRQAAQRRSRSEPDRRKRPRHHLREGRPHPDADPAAATRTTRSSRAALPPADVRLVRRRVDGTHWKRHLPTTALVSSTAINEFYLRPVDF